MTGGWHQNLTEPLSGIDTNHHSCLTPKIDPSRRGMREHPAASKYLCGGEAFGNKPRICNRKFIGANT